MVNANANSEVGGLRKLRLTAGLTQQQLAQRAQCSIAIVRLLESGYRPGRSGVLPRLVAILENDTTPLAGEAVSKTPAGSGDGVPTT
jgi:transcriptional regulator with XRE-family HTH domain